MNWPFRSSKNKRSGLFQASNRTVMRMLVHDAVVGGPHVPREKPVNTVHMERYEKFTLGGSK